MDNVEEQILSYPHLPPDRKRAVEAYVESNPEWAPLLQDVRALEAASGEGKEDPGASVLRAYVVIEHVEDRADRPPALEQTLDRIKRRIDSDPALQAQVAEIRRRVEAAEKSIDPVSHFEQLTGTDATSDRGGDGTADATLTSGAFIRRLAEIPVSVRRAGIVLLVLLGAYLTLAIASRVSQTPLDRLSTINVDEQMLENYRRTVGTSGADSDTLTTGAMYMRTLSTLRNAQTSTLGLFPRSNSDSLRQAKEGLRRVIRRAENGSFLALEAHFYLGKVHLAQRNLKEAVSCFERVVRNEGRRKDEAQRILRVLSDRTRTGSNANG